MKSENEGKRGPGRPRVESRLPDGWKDIIIESGKEGRHITNFLIILGISWDAHRALMERNKEYSTAVNEYKKHCEEFWYEKARESMIETGGLGINTRMWSLLVRNMFPQNWSESTKIDHTTNGQPISDTKPITIEIVRNTQKPNEDGETI